MQMSNLQVPISSSEIPHEKENGGHTHLRPSLSCLFCLPLPTKPLPCPRGTSGSHFFSLLDFHFSDLVLSHILRVRNSFHFLWAPTPSEHFPVHVLSTVLTLESWGAFQTPLSTSKETSKVSEFFIRCEVCWRQGVWPVPWVQCEMVQTLQFLPQR